MSTGSIGLSGVAGVLASQKLTLTELHARGELVSAPAVLSDLGFEHCHVIPSDSDLGELARTAALSALRDAGLEAKDIDVLIWASALPENHVRRSASPVAGPMTELLSRFNYMASWLQNELGLERASVLGNAQQGCSGMFSALRTAHALLLAEPALQHVLCVGADVLPAGAPREIMYNVISDAAAAVVVSRRAKRGRWVGYHQVSKGYYWNIPEKEKEIIASYFPTSRLVINQLLQQAGLKPTDIDCIVPTGVGANSWRILAQLTGIPPERIYQSPRKFGHTIAADNFIHLAEMRAQPARPAGQRSLLFTYGFGSSWCGLVLED